MTADEHAHLQELEGLVKRLRSRIVVLKDALEGLKRGPDCWCEVAIGNPMMTAHSTACDNARDALNR